MKKVIYFDIDDTLYRRYDPFRAAAETFFGAPGTWQQAFEMTQKRCEEVYFPVLRGEMTAEEGFVYRYQKGFEDVGIHLDRQQAIAFRDAYQEAQQHITLDPDIRELLERCREVYDGIGLITNGKGPHQRAKIGQLGLTKWVDEKLIVISGEIGIEKPEPGIFAYAANLADAVPAELTYVGDSVENDILPAKKAGWSAVLWDWKNVSGSAQAVLMKR